MLARNEVVRQVTEVFCLERVVVGDVVTARSLLATIIQVRSLHSEATVLGIRSILLLQCRGSWEQGLQMQCCAVLAPTCCTGSPR